MDALDAVARELSELAKLSADAQALVSSGFSVTDALATGASQRLQNLDLITQRLEELTLFLVHLGRTATPQCQVDTALAASSIRLADMSRRLSCTSQTSVEVENLMVGEPDWF